MVCSVVTYKTTRLAIKGLRVGPTVMHVPRANSRTGCESIIVEIRVINDVTITSETFLLRRFSRAISFPFSRSYWVLFTSLRRKYSV
jgi:hypothetical protein